MAYGFTYTLPTMGTHTNFPVLLREFDFPSAALDGVTAFANGGGDLIAYTDSSKTTQLAVEIEQFVTGASPSVVIWVKVPSASTGATIYLEADDAQNSQPAASSTYGSESVWSDYLAVYHMRGAPTDATGNGYTATLVGTPTTGTAKFGPDCYDFERASNQALQLPTTIEDAITGNNLTVSAWVDSDLTTTEQGIVECRVQTGSGYLLWIDAGGANPGYGFATGTGTLVTAGTDDATSSAGWQRVSGKYDGSNVSIQTDAGTPTTALQTGTIGDGNEVTFILNLEFIKQN